MFTYFLVLKLSFDLAQVIFALLSSFYILVSFLCSLVLPSYFFLILSSFVFTFDFRFSFTLVFAVPVLFGSWLFVFALIIYFS